MLDPRALRRRLLAGAAVIGALGGAAEIWHARSSAPGDLLVEKLSLSYEGNLPTWFSSSLLLLCAVTAGSIARSMQIGERWRLHWWMLAIGLGYASLDEAAELHEHLGGHLETTGLLHFDWVIPAAAILAVLAALYLPFVRALPRATRARLVAAGAIYLGGALLVELPLGWWTERAGPDNLGYAAIDWLEEMLEMIGAALALSALIAHRQELR